MKLPIDPDRKHEIAKTRAALMRRAEVLEVKPFTSLEGFVGDPEITADIDVDDFLWQVREDRDGLSLANPSFYACEGETSSVP